MNKYIPDLIEAKWQAKWQEDKSYKIDLDQPNQNKPRFYILVEFTYPSGDLHIGHWFTFAVPDILARLKRMQGFNVFLPNGFDAFGLPAENAAIKKGIHPSDWTYANIERMKQQFATMGASYDWEHQVITCDPIYYRWNQWMFLKMFQKGLAYKGKLISNWCPSCQTVLANENVEAGTCWRCHSQVIQKEVEQWLFKITAFADRLLWQETEKGSANGVSWPKALRDGQNNWIGKKQGINITYKLKGLDETIICFTTTPVNFGATFIVLAPEHELVKKLVKGQIKIDSSVLKGIEKYLDEVKLEREIERTSLNRQKTGVDTGLWAINHLTGETIPVWISDFVLASIGTGAVQGCPGHDLRDFEFAKRFNLPIKRVVVGTKGETGEIISREQVVESGAKGLMINSDFLNGVEFAKAMQLTMDYFEKKGWGKRVTTYHLHDWSISRQRYWGTPIPIINCPKCGAVPVPEKDLPVELPYEIDYTPRGKPPLATAEKWMKVTCPKCGTGAKREPETMDTFVDSSWYFFRYLDPKNDRNLTSKERVRSWMPIDIYFGGAEHTLGHALYSRFFTQVLHDLGICDFDEYALKRVHHGVILGPDGARMSKSRGNIVNPDDQVKQYGADAVRLYLAFLGPYDIVASWNSNGMHGIYHFLERIWGLFEKVDQKNQITMSEDDLRILNRSIKKIQDDVTSIKFNTAIARLMEWLNYLSRKEKVTFAEYRNYLLCLAPFAPHITEELWQLLGEKESIHSLSWPKVEEKYLEDESLVVVVQVNGKVRSRVMIQKQLLSKDKDVEKMVLKDPRVKKFISGKIVKRSIYVPGRIFNLLTD